MSDDMYLLSVELGVHADVCLMVFVFRVFGSLGIDAIYYHHNCDLCLIKRMIFRSPEILENFKTTNPFHCTGSSPESIGWNLPNRAGRNRDSRHAFAFVEADVAGRRY